MTRPDWPSVATGAALFTLFYAPMVGYSFSDNAGHELAAVPIVGPLVVAAARTRQENESPRGPTGAMWPAFGSVATFQLAGLALMAFGALGTDSHLEPAKAARVGVRGGFTGDAGHIGLGGTF